MQYIYLFQQQYFNLKQAYTNVFTPICRSQMKSHLSTACVQATCERLRGNLRCSLTPSHTTKRVSFETLNNANLSLVTNIHFQLNTFKVIKHYFLNNGLSSLSTTITFWKRVTTIEICYVMRYDVYTFQEIWHILWSDANLLLSQTWVPEPNLVVSWRTTTVFGIIRHFIPSILSVWFHY